MGSQLLTGVPRAVLLDTHVLLWLVSTPDKVAAPAREILADPGTEIMVSAASAWEIAIKTRLDRLDGEPLLSAWSEIVVAMTATNVPIDADDAIFASRLTWDHKDPFDRILVAQATRRNLTIATSDSHILRAALTPTLKT
jgi:PIN domain nuclease of toxin-antitoxin system